ncbi:MAG: MBOAT family O-acyltransferase [Bacteroidia bacterium]
MLFNSIQFLIFFPIVTIIYFLLPHKFRWFHLLISSCIFYLAFIPVYILILFFTIIIDYIAGIMIENSVKRRRKLYLILSVFANVGVLAVFKYYNFFIDNINSLLHSLNITTHPLPFLNIILPIGLSFHTFQAMSYTIEVYRGNQKAERHFGIYSLYVMFYPQLVAGPIERPQNMLHQFYDKKQFDYYNVTDGLKQMIWGLMKKVVIADRIALLTDPVFNNPHSYPPISLLIAVFLFSFQIYYDFSGYSDIALGSAKVMGFKLMKNFDRPYSSKSISEFWSRWHISLSTWFRDYLYISLGGNRVSVPRWFFNLFFVFIVSGFWHGANWTFIIWGALHGIYLICAIIYNKIRKVPPDDSISGKKNFIRTTFSIVSTFFLVAIAWIFFRANNVHDAAYILKKIPFFYKDLLQIIHTHKMAFMNIWTIDHFASKYELLFCVLLIIGIETIDYLHSKYNLLAILKRQRLLTRWLVYYAAIFTIIFMGVFENHQFIYFQF